MIVNLVIHHSELGTPPRGRTQHVVVEPRIILCVHYLLSWVNLLACIVVLLFLVCKLEKLGQAWFFEEFPHSAHRLDLWWIVI